MKNRKILDARTTPVIITRRQLSHMLALYPYIVAQSIYTRRITCYDRC